MCATEKVFSVAPFGIMIAMFIDENNFEEFVLDSGLVGKSDFQIAKRQAKERNQKLGDVLVASGKISEEDMSRIHAYVLGIPFVDLSDEKIDFDILSLIPEPVARKYNIVAFNRSSNALEVAMLDIEDMSAVDFINKKTGLKLIARLTSAPSIKFALLQYQKSLKAQFGDLIKVESQSLIDIDEAVVDKYNLDELQRMSESLPVVRIVDTLLRHTINQGASDIHIEPYESGVIIRYRINSILHDAMVLPRNVGRAVVLRVKSLSRLLINQKSLPQEGRFKIDINGQKIAFRISIFPTLFGEKIVMRLLRDNVSGFTFESLGLHGVALEHLHEVMQEKTGMILVVAPKASGKTTTLYTMLDLLNTPDINISTIEDPIEHRLKRINQSQVNPATGFSFTSGLRSILRQDSDVIMVGDIRDDATLSLATNAALTRHLLLGAFTAKSATIAIQKLIAMHTEPSLLAQTLNMIVGQRLVRHLQNPKEKYFLSKSERAELASKGADMDKVLQILKAQNVIGADVTWSGVPFWRANPSVKYIDGFGGHVGIFEVLKVTKTIRNLITEGATPKTIEDQAKKEGMLTMLEDGIIKAAKGLVIIEDVLRAV